MTIEQIVDAVEQLLALALEHGNAYSARIAAVDVEAGDYATGAYYALQAFDPASGYRLPPDVVEAASSWIGLLLDEDLQPAARERLAALT